MNTDHVDDSVPNVARIYDHLLDGAQSFATDRDRASAISTTYPRAAEWARADRAFIRHAVRQALDLGIRQFLDLGSGIPTAGAVHEIAWEQRADARIAYVDYEPVAVARTQDALTGVEAATITRADVRDPEAVLSAPGVAGLLDLSRPVLLIAAAVLHFVADDDRPGAILARYRRALAPGSVLALSHTSNDLPDDPELAAAHRAVLALYADTKDALRSRTRAELHSLVESAGFTPGPAGLVELGRWSLGHQGRAVGGYALLSAPLT